jgi:non-ribosomal peptide synthetase component F
MATRAALVDERGAITYRELRSGRSAIELRGQGVEAGQAVGILCLPDAAVEAVFGRRWSVPTYAAQHRLSRRSPAATVSTHEVTTVVCDDEFADDARAAGERHRHRSDDIETGQAVSRPKVAAAGRIVLLTSGTTGTPKGFPASEVGSALGIGAHSIAPGLHRVANLRAGADVSRQGSAC